MYKQSIKYQYINQEHPDPNSTDYTMRTDLEGNISQNVNVYSK